MQHHRCLPVGHPSLRLALQTQLSTQTAWQGCGHLQPLTDNEKAGERAIGALAMENPREGLKKFIFKNRNQPKLTVGVSFKAKEVDTGTKQFRSAFFPQSKLGVNMWRYE